MGTDRGICLHTTSSNMTAPRVHDSQKQAASQHAHVSINRYTSWCFLSSHSMACASSSSSSPPPHPPPLPSFPSLSPHLFFLNLLGVLRPLSPSTLRIHSRDSIWL